MFLDVLRCDSTLIFMPLCPPGMNSSAVVWIWRRAHTKTRTDDNVLLESRYSTRFPPDRGQKHRSSRYSGNLEKELPMRSEDEL